MKAILPAVKINLKNLLFLGILCIGLITIDSFLTEQESHPKYQKLVNAATKMYGTFALNNCLLDSLKIPVNSQTDPLKSGYIGIEFSPITTTIGNLPAKQTATNPDFAVLFINWFEELSLTKGDKVIIQASGSFPSLTMAAIIACEEYGLQPIILSSAGASSFGANLPNFTLWDIENNLYKAGYIEYRTAYATAGGQNDNGSSFWEGGMQNVIEAAKRNNIKINIPDNLEQAIQAKTEYIHSKQPIALFINVGGNQTALGSGPCSFDIPTGLITEKFYYAETGTRGLIHLMNELGTPVIHILQIQNLAVQYGIAPEISSDWQPGKSGVYYRVQHKSWFMGLSIFLLSIALFITWKKLSKVN